ncbi:MAG: hypothetical protein DWQ53_18490 [Microcystis flos-aquae DF17]|nr:MAG: hypothetical protein DWQ53_18490 [Microcystis flos-aquae DF17]
MPKSSPRSLPGPALFDFKKASRYYPTRFLDFFSQPQLDLRKIYAKTLFFPCPKSKNVKNCVRLPCSPSRNKL